MSYDPIVNFDYPLILETILECGDVSRPRGMEVTELLGFVIHGPLVDNVLVHPVRDLNYRFMVAEWCWIMAGREDLATLLRFNKNYGKFSDDGLKLAGAYGPRIRPQLDWVLRKLREDHDSRQAVVNLWTPCPAASKDIPCTLSMQFLIRNHELQMIVNMRSSDAWLGLPYDWFTFTMLGNCMAGELGVRPGHLQLHLGSSHLYEEHYELAQKVVEQDSEYELLSSPCLPYLPPHELFSEILREHPGSSLHSKVWHTYQRALRFDKAHALEVLRAAVNP